MKTQTLIDCLLSEVYTATSTSQEYKTFFFNINELQHHSLNLPCVVHVLGHVRKIIKNIMHVKEMHANVLWMNDAKFTMAGCRKSEHKGGIGFCKLGEHVVRCCRGWGDGGCPRIVSGRA